MCFLPVWVEGIARDHGDRGNANSERWRETGPFAGKWWRFWTFMTSGRTTSWVCTPRCFLDFVLFWSLDSLVLAGDSSRCHSPWNHGCHKDRIQTGLFWADLVSAQRHGTPLCSSVLHVVLLFSWYLWWWPIVMRVLSICSVSFSYQIYWVYRLIQYTSQKPLAWMKT